MTYLSSVRRQRADLLNALACAHSFAALWCPNGTCRVDVLTSSLHNHEHWHRQAQFNTALSEGILPCLEYLAHAENNSVSAQ
jgi:hypothetical protein